MNGFFLFNGILDTLFTYVGLIVKNHSEGKPTTATT